MTTFLFKTMTPSLESLLAFVNAEADKQRTAREAFNASNDAAFVEHYGETKVSMESRAFALACLLSYIKGSA